MSLIVIDGLDGSGKATQTQMLKDTMEKNGGKVRMVSFPNYSSDACGPVKMYLQGAFGDSPDSVNAFAASSFYAVDRYASFKKDWEKDYNEGITILCDRYTTSNDIHQMAKLPREQWDSFLQWHAAYEYDCLGIPKPDKIIYLDMDPKVSRELISSRYEGNETKRDIHEKDFAYLVSCRESAKYAAKKQGWTVITCSKEGKPLSPQTIHQMILTEIQKGEKC